MGLNLNPLDMAKGAADAVGDVASGGADAFGEALNAARTAAAGMSAADIGHLVLDGAGMVPVVGEVADLANGAWCAAEGDWANAALSAGAAIPFAGNVATGAKWVKRGVDVADTLSDGARAADKAADGAKLAKAANDGKIPGDGKVPGDGKAPGYGKIPADAKISADARTSKVAPNATVSRTEGKNEFTWTTDSEGRFASGEARLKEDFGGGKRPKSETDAQKDAAAKGKDGDQGGHMFAYRFTKGQGEINLVPQDANLNVGAWKKMENEFADWVNNGKEVNVEVVAKRSSGDRPDTFRASYEVTDPSSGKVIYENSKRFENAPGETFDRVSSKDIKNWGDAG
ncbi:DNA/RNA non-specific endonuclease [Chenggangzhangella methanolivorans]|uniref:DNA/RNA non-specific endonuclease n=1 Tax=Chenggangzhangella methanolivorans TaxID=1437009 RepID=UPI003618DC26